MKRRPGGMKQEIEGHAIYTLELVRVNPSGQPVHRVNLIKFGSGEFHKQSIEQHAAELRARGYKDVVVVKAVKKRNGKVVEAK